MSQSNPIRRRRAPALDVEQRRRLIVEATLPLLLDHGAKVTTSQIARAAGIAEGTVFRAFRDKEELIAACVHAAMRPDDQIDRITALPPELPLRERLVEVAGIAAEHLERMTLLVQGLQASGDLPRHPRQAGPGEQAGPVAGGPPEEMRRLAQALADSLRPDADALRASCDQTARTFLGVLFINRTQARFWNGEPLPPEQLVELFLDGFGRQHPSTTPLNPKAGRS